MLSTLHSPHFSKGVFMENSYTFKNDTLDEFTAKLQSADPIPGGGGAAALCGAIGIALSAMVCEVTKNKKDFQGDPTEYRSMIVKAKRLRESLIDEIDSDAKAFDTLMEAYHMPKTTAEEKALRDKTIQERLIIAAEAPLYTMHVICDTIELFDKVCPMSSANIISDVAVGVHLCRAALNGASMNVYINASLMKDETAKKKYIDWANDMIAKYEPIADKVFAEVKRRVLG